jgi:hypothetical protein
VNVYLKDGKKTYAAFNFQKEPLKVSFSDGFKMTVAPGKMNVETSAN